MSIAKHLHAMARLGAAKPDGLRLDPYRRPREPSAVPDLGGDGPPAAPRIGSGVSPDQGDRRPGTDEQLTLF